MGQNHWLTLNRIKWLTLAGIQSKQKPPIRSPVGGFFPAIAGQAWGLSPAWIIVVCSFYFVSVCRVPSLYANPIKKFVEFVLIVPSSFTGNLLTLYSPRLSLISQLIKNLSLTGIVSPSPAVRPKSNLLKLSVLSVVVLGRYFVAPKISVSLIK